MNDVVELTGRVGFIYRPRVILGAPDRVLKLGTYTAILFSSNLESVGLVTYRHLLVVCDDAFEDVFYATAESNEQEGSSVIYLGQFTPRGHSTLESSLLLQDLRIFLPAACRLARRHLGLDYRQAPLTEMEDTAIGQIPDLSTRILPDGREAGDDAILLMIMESVLAANASDGLGT